jgi:uncharacterized protein
VMRIAAFTDIHGAFTTVVKILQREEPFDVVLLGGDLTTNGTADEAEDGVRRVQSLITPVLVVGGNMDPPELDHTFEDLGVSINGTGFTIRDVGFFGVSAAPFSPLHTPHEISEEQIAQRARRGWDVVAYARWKGFVPHAPPFDTSLDRIFSGRHVGSTAVRQFVEQAQPHVVVCGHIHESRGTAELGASKMVNCGSARDGYYACVHIENDSVRVENCSFATLSRTPQE